MSNYLDTEKSILISAPAGSGKTERLARRYIALLQKGVDVERILAITFTEKASAEMKQRILKLLNLEDKTLFNTLLDKMPLMRVSTIHSFCSSLLRRFSFEADIDPNYRVEDATDARMRWEEILYEVLMGAGRGSRGHDLLVQTLSERGFRGLDYLKQTMDYLFMKSPFTFEAAPFTHDSISNSHLAGELKEWPGAAELIDGYRAIFDKNDLQSLMACEQLFLTSAKNIRTRQPKVLKGIHSYREWASIMSAFWRDKMLDEYARITFRLNEIFRTCSDKYASDKRAKGLVDFSDLEYLAYKMLTGHPEWANILYAFDEKTDHILVDEFQDTNSFQWEIINQLTEEWRSGMGAKREQGIRPTIFLVGDDKQSVYYFRGANVELFHGAKEKLQSWLSDEFVFEEVKENFRSLPAIVEFTNYIFPKIMQTSEDSPAWVTRYNAFNASRPAVPAPGKVELILVENDSENTVDAKKREAEILAIRIQGLVNDYRITDKASSHQRHCRYMDMAILLRRRTHLKVYEEALRKFNIPFVAVKGIGFYQEPEVAMMRAFVFFLSNPRDDYSLYIILKSPVFNICENSILNLIQREGDSLYSKLGSAVNDRENSQADELVVTAFSMLEEWLSSVNEFPLSELLEEVMVTTGAWKYFHESQRRANIKKFIRIIEDHEAAGKSLIRIRDLLERTFEREEEPKANVNTEGMDAVKLMTIHSSKGLEFPIVFIPGLDDTFHSATGDRLVYEKAGRFFFKSISEASIRREDEDFQIHSAKEEEEQKRLFYVAVTRAEDALFLISRWSDKDRSFFGLLRGGLGLESASTAQDTIPDIPGFSILSENDVNKLYEHSPPIKSPGRIEPAPEFIPLPVRKQFPWKAVTETVDIRRRHGKDWMLLGDIIHRLFEGVSKCTLREDSLSEIAVNFLEARGEYDKTW